MPVTWRAWTSLELRRLEELRLEGWTVGEIARRLNRSPKAVKDMARRRGFQKILPRRAEYLQWFERGFGLADIATALGVTRGAVWRFRKRLREQGIEV